MTETRETALRAAIEVWKSESEEDLVIRDDISRILHIATRFEQWLERPTHLILTPSTPRKIA